MPSVDVNYSSPRDQDPSPIACQTACTEFNEANVNAGPAGAATVTNYAYRANNTIARFTTNVEGDALENFLTGHFPNHTVVAVG